MSDRQKYLRHAKCWRHFFAFVRPSVRCSLLWSVFDDVTAKNALKRGKGDDDDEDSGRGGNGCFSCFVFSEGA